MAIKTSNTIEPIGNTWRGVFSSMFNNNNIAREDFQRQVQLMDYQNEFNANEAQKNRDWQEKMSNTAYQRAVEDLKLAGLNPIMAFSSSGASTPSGGTASGSTQSLKTNSSTGDDALLSLVTGIALGLISKASVKKFKVGF